MYYILIVIAFLLSGCGKHNSEPVPIVDAVLLPYVEKFQNQIGVNTNNISVVFGSLNRPTVGFCTTNDSGDIKRKITIDKEYWDNVDNYTKEALIYHELGHCAMHLSHVNDVKNDGCPISIMYPYINGLCYKTYYNDYIQDLINRKNN